MKSYAEAIKKYAVFSGRAGRGEYWIFILFSNIIVFGLTLVLEISGMLLGLGVPLGGFGVSLYTLFIIVPATAVGVRRLHDVGRSGWWLLCPLLNLVFLVMNGEQGENKYGPNPGWIFPSIR